MSFQNAFPEMTAQAPRIAGHQAMPATVLTQLRRQQLHDLAKAYGIPVKVDGTKQEIMPTLIDAESRGVFKGPPVSDYYLQKAARDPDRRAEWTDEPLPAPPAEEVPAPLPAQDRTQTVAPAQPATTSGPTMKELRAEMKERGLNSFGKGRAAIKAELSDAQSDGPAES